MMIAVDWSHIKELTTFDGNKVRIETKAALLKRLMKGESILKIKSRVSFQPSIVLEQGCPMSLVYYFTRHGISVGLIDNKSTEYYRKANGIDKTDEADARIIYHLCNNGVRPQPVTMDNKLIQLHDIYHQYCRYQKARVALQNMKKAHKRQYGTGESMSKLQSKTGIYPVSDLLPYDIAIDTLHAREKSLVKTLEMTAKGLPLFEAGGESMEGIIKSGILQSRLLAQPPAIKGLGKRIWLGLMVTANPKDFKCLSAYLRFCGLVNLKDLNHKYNRHAKMLYHMLAEETMKQRDPVFRPIYDKCKADIGVKYPDYTKGHIHNASLNRVATFLAKHIYNRIWSSIGGESLLISAVNTQPPSEGHYASLVKRQGKSK